MGDDNTNAVAYCVAVEAAVDVYQDQCRELRSSLLQWAAPDQTRRDVAGLPQEPGRLPSPEDSDEDFSAVLAASAEFVNPSAASASGVEAALTSALAAALGNLEKLAEGEASTQLADPGEDEEMGTAELGTALISTQAPCPYSDEHPNNADDPVCHSQPPVHS
jgi:hypothetical protein